MEIKIEQELQKGIAAHKEGRLQEAEQLYKMILKAVPKHPAANHNLAVLAVSARNVKAALPLFKTAVEASPTVEQFWLSYIDAHIREQNLKEAHEVVERAVAHGLRGKKLAHCWKILGALFKQTGNIEEAIRIMLKATEIEPNDPEAQYNLGSAFHDIGQSEKASACFTEATRLKPEFFEAHHNHGNALHELGLHDDAAESYRRAIALRPDNAEAHNNLANMLKETGKLEEAEKSYITAIKISPDSAEIHSNLGNTLLRLGRLDEAEKNFDKAISIKPDFAHAYNNLGIVLWGRGRLEEAESNYRKAISHSPDYAEAHFNLGITLLEVDRVSEAEECYYQAVKLKPDHHDAHNELLKCLYLQGKQERFYEELELLVGQSAINSVIGSLTCRAALKFDRQKPNIFCQDPLKYVAHLDLRSKYDFDGIFIKSVLAVLSQNRTAERSQKHLFNGFQTAGNVFETHRDLTRDICNAIELEIKNYRSRFCSSTEGFITRWPKRHKLFGWIVNMKNGGRLDPHIHDKGWVSGTVYINVPSKTASDNGNLVVALGEDSDSAEACDNEKQVINIATGSLVLFPSSVTHSTIPFESTENRIVLAFDVIPT